MRVEGIGWAHLGGFDLGAIARDVDKICERHGGNSPAQHTSATTPWSWDAGWLGSIMPVADAAPFAERRGHNNVSLRLGARSRVLRRGGRWVGGDAEW